MIDGEVIRLRALRNTALRTRAVAAVLDSHDSHADSVFSRTALHCWRIARTATGHLRAHPHLNYQRGPSYWRSVYDRADAALIGGFAHRRGRALGTCLEELQKVAHELDDARALTWSPELSDALGRSQLEIRALLQDLRLGARTEAGTRDESVPRVETIAGHVAGQVRNDGSGVAANWPYLAL